MCLGLLILSWRLRLETRGCTLKFVLHDDAVDKALHLLLETFQ